MEVTSYVSHVLTHLQSRNTNSVLIHSPTIQTSDFFFFNSLTRKYGIKRRGIYKHNTYRYIENKISSIINSISSYRFNVELNLTAPSVVPGRMSISNRHCILQVFIPFILQSNGCFWNSDLRGFSEKLISTRLLEFTEITWTAKRQVSIYVLRSILTCINTNNAYLKPEAQSLPRFCSLKIGKQLPTFRKIVLAPYLELSIQDLGVICPS